MYCQSKHAFSSYSRYSMHWEFLMYHLDKVNEFQNFIDRHVQFQAKALLEVLQTHNFIQNK